MKTRTCYVYFPLGAEKTFEEAIGKEIRGVKPILVACPILEAPDWYASEQNVCHTCTNCMHCKNKPKLR